MASIQRESTWTFRCPMRGTHCATWATSTPAWFGNGTVVREPILDIDQTRHRVAWAVVGGTFEHYNASVQAFDLDGARTRIRWIADLLPDEAASTVDGMIAVGLSVMKRTLEGAGRGLSIDARR